VNKLGLLLNIIVAIPLTAAAILPGTVITDSGFTPASLSSPTCTPAACDILEGNSLNLPFIAFAGDIVLMDPNGAVSDVVRFFNNVLDTGGGTGFSTLVFMFSKVDTGPDFSVGPDLGLPNPSTYSVNVVTLLEAPGGKPTVYNGNGTLYSFYSDTPEPSSVFCVGAGLLLALTAWVRKR
jgi:hypothetical protein